MASAVSTKKHSTLALAVVVSLLAMLGLVVLPAQTASASVTPGTVSPNVGAASGGLSTTITLATNGGMASSANGVVFLGVDKNLYRVKDGVQLNAGGVSFVSASGFIARDYTVHIMGVGNDGNAYVAIGTTTTMTKVNLANAGITALATYGGMVILGSDKKLYWDGGTAIGGDFTSASTTISAANSYLVNAIGTDSAGYWNATGGAFGKVNGQMTGVQPASVGSALTFVGTDGNVYRSSDGQKLSVTGGVTFASSSGYINGSDQWFMAALGKDGYAYLTAANGTTLNKVTLPGNITAKAVTDGVVALGSDNNVYRLSDGKLISGPTGVTFSSASGYIDNSGALQIVAVGSDGNPYIAFNSTTFSVLSTPGTPKVFTFAKFGGVTTSVTQTGQFTVTATTPSHGAGTVDVVLTASDSSTVTFPAAFTYVGFGITSPTSGQTIPWSPTVTGFGLAGASVAVTAAGVGAVCSAVVDSGGAWSCASTVAFPQQGSFTLKATQTGGGGPSTSTVSVVTSIPANTLSPATGPRSGGTPITVQLGANGGQRSSVDGELYVGLDGTLRSNDASHTVLSAPAGVSFTDASSDVANGRFVAAIGSDGTTYYNAGTSTMSPVKMPTGVTGVKTFVGTYILGSDGNVYVVSTGTTTAPLISGPGGGVTFTQVSGFRYAGSNYASAIGSDGNLYYNGGTSTFSKQSLPTTPIVVKAATLSGNAVLGTDNLVYKVNGANVPGPNGLTFTAASGAIDDTSGTWVTSAIGADNNAYYGSSSLSKVTLSTGAIPKATINGTVLLDAAGRAYRAADGSLMGGIPNGVTLTSVSAAQGVSGSYVAAIGSDGIAYSAVAGATSFSAVALSNAPKTYTSVSTGGAAATGVSQSGLTSSVSVSATTYSHAPGLVNVVLTASDGSTLTLPNSFTFADFTISSPTSNQFVSRYPTITGVGLPGASVAVSVASLGTLCSTTVDSGGAWSCTSTVQLPAYGGFTLSAVQTGGGSDANASVPIFVAVAVGFAITSPTAGQTIPWSPTVAGTGYPGTTVAVTALGIGALCSAVVDSGGAWSCVSSVTFPQQGSFTLTAVQTGAASPVSAAVSVVTSIPAATLSPAVGPRSGGTAITVQLGANGGQRSTFDGEGYVGLDGVLRLNDTSHMTLSAPAGVSFTNASSFANSSRYVAAIGSDGKAYYNSAASTLSAVGLPTGVTGVTTAAGSWVLGSDGNIYSASTAAVVTGASGVTFTQISGFKYGGSTYLGAIASDGSLYYGNSGSVAKVGTVTVSAISGSVALGTDGLVYTINGPKVSSTNGVTFKAASGDLDLSNGNWVTAAISSDNKAYYTSGGTLTQVTLAGGVTPAATYGGAVFVGTDGRAYRANDGSLIAGIPNGVSLTSISASLGLSGSYVAAIGSDGIAYSAVAGATSFSAVALSNAPKTYTSVSTGGAAATGVSQSGLTSSVSVSATTYSHAPGLVNVVLTASDGSTLTLPNSFTFADFAISSPTPNQYVTRFPTITGIGLPGTSVAVSVASVGTLCSTTVDSGGAWSCASTLQLPQHGTFTLNAAQTGIGNPASASVSVVVSVDWTVSTSATVAGAAVANGALVAPGSTITYQVDYVSSAAIAMAGVTSADDLTGVLDDATFVANSAQLVVNGAAAVPVSDPSASVLTVPAFSLPAGKSAVLTYQVTVNANRWGAVLSRTVTATSTTEPPLSCGAACSTSEQTAVPLQVQKVGEDSSANVVPMTGSQWAVYSSANATTPVVGPIPAGSDVGLFRSTALPAGTYWLEESTSLSGFSLLAQRVQFTLNPDLSITLVSSPSNVTVTTVNGSATIRVMDVPRMALPQAGGPGTLIFYLAGFALLAVAVVAVVVAALVRRLRSSERIRKVIS